MLDSTLLFTIVVVIIIIIIIIYDYNHHHDQPDQHIYVRADLARCMGELVIGQARQRQVDNRDTETQVDHIRLTRTHQVDHTKLKQTHTPS